MRQLSLHEAFSIEWPQRAALPIVDAATTWCYVCHESTTETCQCACKATVHAHCLLKCVRVSGLPYCTICLGRIANLKVHRWRRITRRSSTALVASGVAICYYSVYSAVMVGRYVEEKDPNVEFKCMMQCVGSLIMACMASKVCSRLLEMRDSVAEHVEYEYR
jgi:hypothetical protein